VLKIITSLSTIIDHYQIFVDLLNEWRASVAQKTSKTQAQKLKTRAQGDY